MSQMLQQNKIVQKDAVEFISGLPSNCIDLVLTDPPYGVDATSWDDVAPLDWCNDIARVMKDNSSLLVFCGKQNRFDVESALRKTGLIFWQEIIWVYRNGGVTRKNSYNGHHEPILWFVKNPDKFYFNLKDKMWIDTWTVINSARPQTNYKKDKKIHPTQKAIDVIKRLIEYHSKEGDLVLDPYMGSGTTAVASKQLHRNFLGCEINKEYVKIAKERLKQS